MEQQLFFISSIAGILLLANIMGYYIFKFKRNFEAEQASRIKHKTMSEKLQRELNTNQTELAETQVELEKKKKEVNHLEESLEAKRAESEKLQQELNTTQVELKDQKNRVNCLEKNLQAERASRIQYKTESERLQRALNITQVELEKKKKEINRLKKRVKDIGGKRGSGSNGPEYSTNHQTEYNPKPDLVCRKNGWQWEIVLVVPEERLPVEIQQNGVSLSGSNGEYRLNDFSEDLTVIYEANEERVELYNDQSPLIFKLRKKWKGDGRKVRALSRGYFIVFALNEWQRRGTKEACSDGRFSAHYFYADDNITTDDFEGHELPSNQEGFSLRGSHIYDNSEKGLLFIEDPPNLEPAESVLWARIGEEGGGDWKGENFKPAEKTVKEVLNGQQGWFYVRVYDNEVKLIDSNDFRYSQTLKEIWVNGTMYSEEMLLVPSANGYMETTIQFIDTKGNNISPEKMGNNSHASIYDDGAVIVAPHPDGDLTEWKVDRVDTVISLPRIWWRITKTDNSSDEWIDTPIVMSRKEFRENTDAVVQISLPSNIEKIQVGFGFDLHRSYSTDDENQNKRRIELPIRDFVDYEEIEIPFSKNIYLNIQCNGKILPIICVPAEEPLLKKILINDTIYPEAMLLVPSTDGYTETISIRFIDAKGSNIRPKQKGNNSRVSICDDGAVIFAPPDSALTKGPDSDLTEWNVDNLDKVVSLPRIWWRITKTNDFSDGWCDEPIVMPRQKFRRNMNAIVQISLPSSVYKIRAEFGSDFQRSYSYKPTTDNKNKRIFELPIRDLDYKEIERPSSKSTYLNIQCNEEKLLIIRVPAEGEICPECDSNRLTKINSEKDKLMWYQCQLCKWESQKYNVLADESQSAIQITEEQR